MSIIYHYLKQINGNSNKKIIFHYWTTSDFESDVISELNNMKKKLRKYSIETKNGKEICDFVKNKNLTNICELLREHFFA
jgi:glucose-6-phosphate isomerase